MTTNQPPDFPAGVYVEPGDYDAAAKQAFVKSIESFPAQLATEVAGLTDEHLDTKYRNWTIRQIVHHLADSHVNCYIRFKWTLTESTPTIKSCDETLWSQVADAQTAPVVSSLSILDGIHCRWGQLMRRLDGEAMARGFFMRSWTEWSR